MKRTIILLLTLSTLLLTACSDDKFHNNIPYKEVNFLVYPLTDFNKALTSPGGAAITGSCNFNGGQSCGYSTHGVIVCRMMNTDSYAAYAATCPDDLNKLQIANDAILKAKCPKCGRFFELDNNGRSGNLRLTQYRIQMSITGQFFRVSN